MLAQDENGDILTKLVPILESDFDTYTVSFTVLAVKYRSDYVVVYDRYRQNWEVPGGGIEVGESVRECAVRELFEESGQVARELKLNGIINISTDEGKTVQGALFSGVLDEIRPFEPNAEIAGMMLWDGESPLRITPINKKLLALFDVG